MHGRKQPEEPQATEIQVNIHERHTIEQIALEVQRALAMVQDYGAIGLEKFRFRLLPLDAEGLPMILRNGQGHQVTAINIPEKPAEPVYRKNEPGVGVRTATQTPTSKAGITPSR
jgi:hypothetical protein